MIRARLRCIIVPFALAVLVGCTAGGGSTTSAATITPSTMASATDGLTGVAVNSPTTAPKPTHTKHKAANKPPVHDPNNPVAPGFA